jgi:hypothetical protein
LRIRQCADDLHKGRKNRPVRDACFQVAHDRHGGLTLLSPAISSAVIRAIQGAGPKRMIQVPRPRRQCRLGKILSYLID